MVRVCYSPFHKGDPIFGEKAPYEDKSLTHGLCPSCFELEMEEIEKMGRAKDWREEWREFKKNKGRINMPRERQPKKGDFVLWEDGVWLIRKILKIKTKTYGTAYKVVIENCETGDFDELLADNLAPTSIQTWEAE